MPNKLYKPMTASEVLKRQRSKKDMPEFKALEKEFIKIQDTVLGPIIERCERIFKSQKPKKYFKFSTDSKKTNKRKDVRKWLAKVEDVMNREITPEVVSAYALGYPIFIDNAGKLTIKNDFFYVHCDDCKGKCTL